MDLTEFVKNLGAAAAMVASTVGAAVGLKTLVEKHRANKKAFLDSLPTKEQVDRYKQANEEQIKVLKEHMDIRLGQQDERLLSIEENMRDLPLKVVSALRKHQ